MRVNLPQTSAEMKQWAVDEHERFSFATESPQSRGFSSLKFTDQAPIPSLGDTDVLVHFKYASLNYRDIVIPQVSTPNKCRRLLPLSRA